jgi:hypothetical protein
MTSSRRDAQAVLVATWHDGLFVVTAEGSRQELPGQSVRALASDGLGGALSASDNHFATRGAVYRRPMTGRGMLVPVAGLPTWLDGIVDTGCIATRDSAVAVADRAGNLYVSSDRGSTWSCRASRLPTASSLLVV